MSRTLLLHLRRHALDDMQASNLLDGTNIKNTRYSVTLLNGRFLRSTSRHPWTYKSLTCPRVLCFHPETKIDDALA